MLSVPWDEIRALMQRRPYMSGVNRTADRVQATAEIFTPTDLVLEMVRRVPLERFAPGQRILDPACGDGQFLEAAKWLKVKAFGVTEARALHDIYGVDIMRDNVDLCLWRLGGGTIVMGDALNPLRRLKGQSAEEQSLMQTIFLPARDDVGAQLDLAMAH